MRGEGALLPTLALLLLAAAPSGWAGSAPPSQRQAAYAGLDAADAGAAAATLQRALERSMTYGSLRWQSAGSGTSGMVTPLGTFKIADGRYCRDYLEVVVPPGRAPLSLKGTTCRAHHGLWLLVAP
jgi:surface antigen